MVYERFFKWIPYFKKRLWRGAMTLRHEAHRTPRCILTRACHGRHLNIGQRTSKPVIKLHRRRTMYAARRFLRCLKGIRLIGSHIYTGDAVFNSL